jgi:hypothetical protein
LFGEFFAEVLDEDVGETLGLFAQLLLAFLAGDEAADVDLIRNKSLIKSQRKIIQIILSIHQTTKTWLAPNFKTLIMRRYFMNRLILDFLSIRQKST